MLRDDVPEQPEPSMYLPKQFEERRTEVLHGLINQQPLGALVAVTRDGLCVNHVPFLIDAGAGPFGVLRAHVARANPLWQAAIAGTEAVAIFQGPQQYISPSWYPSKQEAGKAVPTWNYVVVHAHGPLTFVEDTAWLHAHVDQLSQRHEATRPAPWKLADAPSEYIDKQLRHIVGVELTITRLSGKWKLGQNRSAEDRRGVIQGLRQQGDAPALQVAALMQAALDGSDH